MKRYLALILFILMLCAFLTSAAPVVAEEVEPVVTEPAVEGDTVTIPLPDVEVPKEVITTTEGIVKTVKDWLATNYEEIMVVVYLSLSIVYSIRRNKTVDTTCKTLNNNSVEIAKTSESSVEKALAGISAASATVGGFEAKLDTFLAESRTNAEEKQKLEVKLAEATNYINASQMANTELANVVAELLVLANIPNSKKEELYSRHIAASKAIAEAVNAAKAEVKEDVEQA